MSKLQITNCNSLILRVKKACSPILLLFLLFFSAILFAKPEQARITDIRFWQSPEEAQIVFDLTSAPSVSSISRLNDGTLFFDIHTSLFRPGRQRYTLDNPFIDVLTIQQRDDINVRVFFRVPSGVDAKTFVLPKNENQRDRIIIFLRQPEIARERRMAELTEVNKLRERNVKIVVLDPGHGGEDPGTSHNGIVEKEYVLMMGRLIKAYFDRDPHFKAIMTRDGDYIIPLTRRREIAEYVGADAFVSLHINFNHSSAIRGAEVYYESARGAVGEAERLVAQKENQVDFAGNTPTRPIDLKKEIVEKQAATMNKSRQLAEKVELRMANAVTGYPSRGVRRAGFKVLHSLQMPSILVEFGYISNLSDLRVLKNYSERTRLAQALYLGIRDYLLGNVEEGLDVSYLEYLKTAEAKRATPVKKVQARPTRHIVRKGDTLSGIAKKYKVSLSSITKLNNITAKSIIKIGQTILVPAK